MLFKDLLGKKTLFFDGAMGTMLQAAGLKPGELPELWNFSHAGEVEKIHTAYLNAGADIIKTNTFGANRLKFAGTEIKTADVIEQAVAIAKKACGKKPGSFVALDMGPTGKLLAPYGDLPFEEAVSIYAEIVQVGNKDVRGCIACRRCVEFGKCVFDDVVNELAPKFEEADGIVVASPVYFASANATLIATLDRLFFSTSFDKTMKVGASVVCARRGGCSATFDELNKYFTISNMPIAASQYWNCIHGRELGEADRDEEGKQTMRVLARNMTFLMKSIELGKKQFGLPEKEERVFTHFIR